MVILQENNIITKSKFENIRIINILMYVFLCKTPIYLRILFYLIKNCELSEEINVEMRIFEKIKETHNKKGVS